MSREKQIEEMAKIFCGMKNGCDGCMWNKVHCCERNDAEDIYNADYRKQSGWISVKERLPEAGVDVLVALKIGDRVSVDTDRIYGGKWFGYGEMRGVSFVTHWMPFPEAPKMKGGAE